VAKKATDFSLQSIPTWAGIVSTIIGGGVGAFIMYKAFASDMPEIKQSLQIIQKQLMEVDGRQRELAVYMTQEQANRQRMDNSLRVLQTNMVTVIQKVERRRLKANEVREIMASVHDVSASEGANFNSTTTDGSLPAAQMPSIVTAMAGELTQEQALFFSGVTVPYKGKSETIDKLLARGFLANGRWEATANGLTVTYPGGATKFAAKQDVTADELQRKADLFNSYSQALSQTLGSPDAWPSSPKSPKEVQK
jgi:hypothetical protein